MAKHDQVPKYHELMNPLLKALNDLGGSGSIEEILSKVSDSLDLSEDVLVIPHNPDKSSLTELEYRLAWARTYLKKYGIIDNSERGVWAIVPEKREVTGVKPQHVVRTVREMTRKEREGQRTPAQPEEELPEEAEKWRSKLHHVLTKELSPDAFERLVKRMLRESGFIQVEVTGRTGDGGIDGKASLKLAVSSAFMFYSNARNIRAPSHREQSAISGVHLSAELIKASLSPRALSRGTLSVKRHETVLHRSTSSTEIS